MTEPEDIARRLDAVADVDWTIKRVGDVEYYGDWIHVGPVMMRDFDPEDELPQHREQVRREKRLQEAIIDFLQHAADDLHMLLIEWAAAQARKGSPTDG